MTKSDFSDGEVDSGEEDEALQGEYAEGDREGGYYTDSDAENHSEDDETD